jgi:hypothetical protein
LNGRRKSRHLNIMPPVIAFIEEKYLLVVVVVFIQTHIE